MIRNIFSIVIVVAIMFVVRFYVTDSIWVGIPLSLAIAYFIQWLFEPIVAPWMLHITYVEYYVCRRAYKQITKDQNMPPIDFDNFHQWYCYGRAYATFIPKAWFSYLIWKLGKNNTDIPEIKEQKFNELMKDYM